jgi:aspartate kinase
METIVQKYGGSSLAEDEQLRAVAERVAECRRAGNRVVVVVSARGNTTSRLLSYAGKVNSNPDNRELDMLLASGEQLSASLLSITLQDMDIRSVALTGPQAGVLTCDSHLNARISTVDPRRMNRYLDEGAVVVVAGFQGETPNGDITTLGRGGSDTTAVAIAAAVKADRCEIYSDVDGVYTADPRVVPDATRLNVISHAEMKAMAHHGAGVLNERAIDYAIEQGVTIHARKAHGEGGETILRPEAGGARSRIVGVAGHDELLCVKFDQTADADRLRAELDDYQFFVPEEAEGHSGLCLIPLDQVPDPDGLADAIREEFPDGVEVSGSLATVSAIGYEAGKDDSIRDFAVNALARKGIELIDVMVFEHAVTCMIEAKDFAEATRCFHDGFRITDAEVANVA